MNGQQLCGELVMLYCVVPVSYAAWSVSGGRSELKPDPCSV